MLLAPAAYTEPPGRLDRWEVRACAVRRVLPDELELLDAVEETRLLEKLDKRVPLECRVLPVFRDSEEAPGYRVREARPE